ncbi:hypothetical protein B0J12DRAFT_695564 [Macrophomina phaseolina]|uniref:Protein kinase domain-containing protein n=1 Tax=Macrophomina phaseolina TaxID=35725 RepID=A0ABQ8GNS0_9PEZI|nr:hypothetical protein B0J12DRAFT_695564 [Macrophomina phaseolina]
MSSCSPTGQTILAPRSSARNSFVPQPNVQEYLTRDKVRRIIQALWQDNDALADELHIAREYPKVFYILLLMSRGRSIENFIKHDTFGDSKFPSETKPAQFPHLGGESCSFDMFSNCKPINTFGSHHILPITSVEPLAKGAIVITSIITLHPAYNILDTTENTEKTSPLANTYVIKAYSTKDARKHYESEAGFYGSFVYKGVYNIILEYADRGTRTRYYQTVDPPSNGPDIIEFWSFMFGLIKALLDIHHVRISEPGMPEEHLPSTMRGHFKRAAAQRKRRTQLPLTKSQQTVTFMEPARTSQGAPECYWPNDFIRSSCLSVDQSVDISSLGCVFSEAAVWGIKGKEGIKSFEATRQRETQKKNVRDTGCFHDGEIAFKCVLGKHSEIQECRRECDYITERVLHMVENMLGKTARRSSAKQLHAESGELIVKARKDARKGWKRRASSRSSQPMSPPASPPVWDSSVHELRYPPNQGR